MDFVFFNKKHKAALSDKPLAEQTDSELVESADAGNADAFTELVKRYEKFVYNTAYFHVKNADDAYDVSQEVFIRVYGSIESFKGESAFSTWLYRLCKNVTYDYMRKHYKHKTLSVSELSEPDGNGEGRAFEIADTDSSTNPEEALEKKYEVERVRRAIKMLSDEHRDIIILRELEERPYDEIAGILGIEEGTVKSRLNRARINLKKILSEI